MRAPWDYGLQGRDLLMRHVANIGVEPVVPDRQRVVVESVSRFCFRQMPPHSTRRPRGERAGTRKVGAIGLSLVTGSTEIARSKVRVEIDRALMAVPMSAAS